MDKQRLNPKLYLGEAVCKGHHSPCYNLAYYIEDNQYVCHDHSYKSDREMLETNKNDYDRITWYERYEDVDISHVTNIVNNNKYTDYNDGFVNTDYSIYLKECDDDEFCSKIRFIYNYIVKYNIDIITLHLKYFLGKCYICSDYNHIGMAISKNINIDLKCSSLFSNIQNKIFSTLIGIGDCYSIINNYAIMLIDDNLSFYKIINPIMCNDILYEELYYDMDYGLKCDICGNYGVEYKMGDKHKFCDECSDVVWDFKERLIDVYLILTCHLNIVDISNYIIRKYVDACLIHI